MECESHAACKGILLFAINSLGRRFAVLKLSISAGPAGPDRVLQVESDDLEIRAGCGVQKGPLLTQSGHVHGV